MMCTVRNSPSRYLLMGAAERAHHLFIFILRTMSQPRIIAPARTQRAKLSTFFLRTESVTDKHDSRALTDVLRGDPRQFSVNFLSRLVLIAAAARALAQLQHLFAVHLLRQVKNLIRLAAEGHHRILREPRLERSFAHAPSAISRCASSSVASVAPAQTQRSLSPSRGPALACTPLSFIDGSSDRPSSL